MEFCGIWAAEHGLPDVRNGLADVVVDVAEFALLVLVQLALEVNLFLSWLFFLGSSFLSFFLFC